MKHNFYLRARHVPGIYSEIAYALSRFQDTRFRAVAPPGGEHPLYHPAFAIDPLRKEVPAMLTGE